MEGSGVRGGEGVCLLGLRLKGMCVNVLICEICESMFVIADLSCVYKCLWVCVCDSVWDGIFVGVYLWVFGCVYLSLCVCICECMCVCFLIRLVLEV